MNTVPRVRDWMTADPITISPDTTVVAAVALMNERSIRHLPVVDAADGRLLNCVTKQQLRQAHFSVLAVYAQSATETLAEQFTTVGELPLPPLVALEADAPITRATTLLLANKLTGLPVVENGRLIGILTESDIYRLVNTILEQP